MIRFPWTIVNNSLSLMIIFNMPEIYRLTSHLFSSEEIPPYFVFSTYVI